MIPLNKPDLSFKAQQAALAKAVAAPQETGLGQSYQAANALLSQAAQYAHGRDRASMTGQDALGFLGNLPDVPMPSSEDLAMLLSAREGRKAVPGMPTPDGPQGPAKSFDLDQRQQEIYQKLRARGMNDIQAKGSILNFMDESGLKSDIVEGAPNIHGTRGQGLYQLTDNAQGKGRRSDYLNWLAQNKRNDAWSDDSQLDFYVWETQNTEKANWEKFANAGSVGEFASGMVQHFLRPAEQHRIARQQKYRQYG